MMKSCDRNMAVLLLVATLLVSALPAARAQNSSTPPPASPASSDNSPRFDVASIKHTTVDPKAGGGIQVLPGGQTYVAKGASLQLMILLMFHLNENQLIGSPSWVGDDVFDVDAKADAPHSLTELRTMFQNLILDRFKLQFHYETRTLPMFALTVEKSGPKMKPNSGPETFAIPLQRAGYGKLQAAHCSMSHFAWFLSELPQLTRPVADETGLDGFYDFTLEYTPQAASAGEQAKAQLLATGPDLTTALREQLGLHLEARKGPIQVMVVDHVEKPSAN